MGVLETISYAHPDLRALHNCHVLSGTVALVDGRYDLKSAFMQARYLIQEPDFHTVVIVRDRSAAQLEENAMNLFTHFANGKFGRAPSSGLSIQDKRTRQHERARRAERGNFASLCSSAPARRAVVFSQKNALYYQSAQNEFKKDFRLLGMLEPLVGREYSLVFSNASEAFPEYLSWDIRSLPSINAGGIHKDAAYNPDLNPLTKLPSSLLRHCTKSHLPPLSGSVTLTCALKGGGSIVCPSQVDVSGKNFFEEPDIHGLQVRDGDICIMRAEGWPDGFEAAQHCSAKKDGFRIVAVASSNASYLSPQVFQALECDV